MKTLTIAKNSVQIKDFEKTPMKKGILMAVKNLLENKFSVKEKNVVVRRRKS